MPPREKTQPKRQRAITQAGNSFSRSLRAARELISTGDQAAGLTCLNTFAGQTRDPRRRAKILLIIGESETTFSRHSEAAAAFAKAANLARQAADLDLLLLASTGQVRALLRSLRTADAITAAQELLGELESAQNTLDETLALTPDQLAARGPVEIPARPPRPTVGLTKLAHAFLESGHTDQARIFLHKAIQLSPNGASRARQVLARLALASDEPALAERYARESLLMGRFQTKTTAAWPLYLDARARQNVSPILEPDVLAAFRTHAKGRTAAASIACIIRSLRAHSDPAWKTLAESAIVNNRLDPILRNEIEKIILADIKLYSTDTPRPIAARALRLYRAADCSAKELISHAKTYVRHSLLADEEPNLSQLNRIANRRFPNDPVLQFAVRHTAALGAMMAVKHDLARGWLSTLIGDTAATGNLEAWGKATWALARMEALLENDAQAAFCYLDLAANEQTPSRFRIQAMLRGLRHLGKTGDHSTDIGQLTEKIRSILNGTDDFRLLLDAARQLALAGSNFSQLKDEAANRGTDLADQAIAAAKTPQEQLTHLEYLARKLYWDLGRTRPLLQRWEALSEKQKADYRATGGSTWYEYLSLVFLSLTETDRSAEAAALASSVLDHDTATPEGYVILGSTYAVHLLENGQRDKAFEYFTWIAKEVPTHRMAAVAHYWRAVWSLKNSAKDAAATSAQAVRACFGGRPCLLPEWELDAAALMIIYYGDSTAAIAAANGFYSLDFLMSAATRVARQVTDL
jgi:tetratricopeptide (TPR) repeat protein